MPLDIAVVQKNFGQNLKRIRLSKGMSQLELAANTGLEIPNISTIENGRANITLRMAVILADGLGIHFKELFNFD